MNETRTQKTNCTDCDAQDYADAPVTYCKGDEVWTHTLFHDFSCDGGACVESTYYIDDTLVQDCNAQDGWYDVGQPYACCDNNSACTCQDQEYRDYFCSGGSCTYAVNETRTQKTNCTACDAQDYYGDWEYYCQGDEVWKHQIFHDFSCVNGTCVEVSSDCVNNQLVEDCNAQDGWYDVGQPYACCDNNSACTCQDQEYRDYFCSGGSCTYAVNETRTQKTNCTSCDDGNPCTIDTCENGVCVHTPIYADILDYYRSLNGARDEVDTSELLAAVDDWLADVVPPCFEEPITTPQLMELIDEWLASD